MNDVNIYILYLFEFKMIFKNICKRLYGGKKNNM